jgi:hypothetical protein
MDEFRFEQDLVRALLREQHPDLAGLELRDVAGAGTTSSGASGRSWPCACRAPSAPRPCCAPSRSGCPFWRLWREFRDEVTEREIRWC